jgi:isoquinoline 1-oxidoreductase beta subunit
MNQLTGGSNSMRSMYLPVRTAAAIARQRLVEVAAAKWSADATRLTTKDGVVTGPDGQTASYGELAAAAAAGLGDGPAVSVTAQLKPESDFTILGTPQSRIDAGDWGKAMPSRTAQGIAVHSEYQGAIAVLAEIDCTPATASRPITDGVTGPRVTKALVVVDAGFAVNPRGLQAQMIGGVQDGIALALTSSLHIAGGIPLEGSWDNYFYTREWNTPLDVEVIVMPATSNSPGGAGELGVAPAMAAVACAYARATGTLPTRFPINHGTLGFTPLPREPSTPQSPTNGLDSAF